MGGENKALLHMFCCGMFRSKSLSGRNAVVPAKSWSIAYDVGRKGQVQGSNDAAGNGGRGTPAHALVLRFVWISVC